MKRQRVIEKDWILTNSLASFVEKAVKELSGYRAVRLTSLFQDGCENAYIARYREDVHGGLQPEKIRKAKDAYLDALQLNAKVTSAITTITPKIAGAVAKQTVKERLIQCEDIDEVTDICKEFAVGARKTKANISRDLGLEPPATSILHGNFVDFNKFLSNELKSVKDVEEHMKVLVADLINKDIEVRKLALKIVKLNSRVPLQVSAKLTKDAEKNREQLKEKNLLKKYDDYIGKRWSAGIIKSYQVSALNRGTEENIIMWKVECKIDDAKRDHPFSKKKVDSRMQSFFVAALKYSITAYFIPMVERGTKRFLTRMSEDRNIVVFGENIEELFTQEGVHSKYIIALDPGHTVKTAFLNPSGNVIATNQFLIRDSTFDNRGTALLKSWSSQTKGKDLVFAIGNGSNTHNTQKAVSKMIANNDFFEEIDVCFCVVPEHGASKYSCTPAALEEFGEDAEIKHISAISIGRRLIDPMSEYVKIEPQHLGKGQYQLSVDDKLLKEKLVAVVRDRVSLIGADLNLASEHLLRYICGLNQTTASGIVKYREKYGRFKSREELKNVKGIGEVTYQQCAGFLTVSRPDDSDDGPAAKRFKGSSESWSPFDVTTVHPEDYGVARELLEKIGHSLDEIVSGTSAAPSNLTVQEKRIYDLLMSKPELRPPPLMMKKAKEIKDLERNQVYKGVVTNRTDFGVFVDIGVERDGLIHISCYPIDDASTKPLQTNKNSYGKREYEHKSHETRKGVPSVGTVLDVRVNEIRDDRISLKPV
ncbi:hypothetical protein GCK72_002292 [Caenorhabditis remanei]|uniref:S1 motif domain-containing protein n=1 Tax=Caenorhabditis remanei TaxID=31234 RepID=A0A6A5HVZ2_CAERE|nr:hypothetical protein GCK72_002292 [Caenorhabditis remanei]KAF1770473.1 hypothetical protein GCK72_002292 [Caenorhabditis remanei]